MSPALRLRRSCIARRLTGGAISFHQARPFGICKIVPPPTWKPPFMLDTKNFTVRTRVQQVNYLDGQARQRLIFVENLCRFWSKRGQELEKLPVIAQAPLDVCRCAGDVWCALVPFSARILQAWALSEMLPHCAAQSRSVLSGGQTPAAVNTANRIACWHSVGVCICMQVDKPAGGLTRLVRRLYHEVRLRGGLAAVTEKKLWAEVARAMDMESGHGSMLAAACARCSLLSCCTCALAPLRPISSQ